MTDSLVFTHLAPVERMPAPNRYGPGRYGPARYGGRGYGPIRTGRSLH